MLHRAWFCEPPARAAQIPARPRIGVWLTAPPIITASFVVAIGVLANAPFSPLEWVRFIVEAEFDGGL